MDSPISARGEAARAALAGAGIIQALSHLMLIERRHVTVAQNTCELSA